MSRLTVFTFYVEWSDFSFIVFLTREDLRYPLQGKNEEGRRPPAGMKNWVQGEGRNFGSERRENGDEDTTVEVTETRKTEEEYYCKH